MEWKGFNFKLMQLRGFHLTFPVSAGSSGLGSGSRSAALTDFDMNMPLSSSSLGSGLGSGLTGTGGSSSMSSSRQVQQSSSSYSSNSADGGRPKVEFSKDSTHRDTQCNDSFHARFEGNLFHTIYHHRHDYSHTGCKMLSKKSSTVIECCFCAGQLPPGRAVFRTHPTRTAARITTVTTHTATGRPITLTTSRIGVSKNDWVGNMEMKQRDDVFFEICRYVGLGNIERPERGGNEKKHEMLDHLSIYLCRLCIS